MNSIDLTPLYRNSIGFDRLESLFDSSLKSDSTMTGYPPYNIEVLDDKRYAIDLAVAGFNESELDIKVEKGVLTIRGEKKTDVDRKYLHQGIANRTFERKFNLADYVEVTGADLKNGLLTISLLKEIPEAMKPQSITINQTNNPIEHRSKVSASSKAA